MQLSTDLSALRKDLWRSYAALAHTLRRLQRSELMVQGSFYLLRRKCGNPRCRCAQGQLHGSWVITRSEKGKDRIYSVPTEERGRLRQLTGEYRRYQRARAVLVKRHIKLLELADAIAEKRLLRWPEEKLKSSG